MYQVLLILRQFLQSYNKKFQGVRFLNTVYINSYQLAYLMYTSCAVSTYLKLSYRPILLYEPTHVKR